MDKCILGFNRERYDPVNGITHLGNGYRCYSPEIMLFRSPDAWSPFGKGGINSYIYCSDDPVNLSDPSGHNTLGGWISIGLAFSILLTPVSGGSSLAVALSATAVVAGLTSAGLAIAQQLVEKSHPDTGEVLSWAALATGLISGASSIALSRIASDSQTLTGLIIRSLRRTPELLPTTDQSEPASLQQEVHINLHPANSAPVQFYKGMGIEVAYSNEKITDVRVTGFTSNFSGTGDPGLIVHRNSTMPLRFTVGMVSVREGRSAIIGITKSYSVPEIIRYFKERNIDLVTIARDKPFHLVACKVTDKDGAAQALANMLNRTVEAYGMGGSIYHAGLSPMGNGRVFTMNSNVPLRPITFQSEKPTDGLD